MLRSHYTNEIFTIALMLGLLSITLAKLLAPKRFEDFLLIIGDSKYLKIYHREPKLLDQFNALLFINLTIGLTIFSFIFYRQAFNASDNDLSMLLKFFMGISSFILTKMVIERLIAYFFEIDKLIDQYLFQKTTYKNYLGLLLIPVNGILLYNYNNSTLLIYIVIGVFWLINIIGVITSIKTYQGVIFPNLFYFILYICALEIAPYIILYKAIIS